VADFTGSDDAAVVRLDGDKALVQTLDFFTPIVDDPFAFGQIAATNSLSDIYAMGATPLFALNIVAFPKDDLPMEILGEILKGGASKAKEAGINILGGHSIDDKEPKYGLVVTGEAEADQVVTNGGAQAGDALVLTKPLGSGIIATAIKRGEASQDLIDEATAVMCTLNAEGGKLMIKHDVSAATDVTGFGLLGHLLEMCEASGVSAELHFTDLPFVDGIQSLAERGIVPGGTKRNLEHVSESVHLDPELSEVQLLMAADAQTSGGLLISIPEEKADDFISDFEGKTLFPACRIGTIKTGTDQKRISFS
tara:strand:+ start:2057 stop:2983 length:927 start_codon:yes stop_codon:yes gene_type:complete